jgi:hypothetical protein
MLRTPLVSLPLPEPIALIDATLLFALQVLLARHPDLLAPPEEAEHRPPPGLRAARHILDAVRELHHALESYRAFLPDTISHGDSPDDDIPF